MPKVSPFDSQAHPVTLCRIDALTGLRGYAAILVVLFHISLNRFFLNDPQIVESGQFVLSNAGWFGVTFFFVLSGFVLTWSLRSSDRPMSFICRRLAKIAPNHMATFFVAFLMAGLGASNSWEALSNLFLMHAWVPRDTAFFSINHPSWSLSAELFFYAMFPFALVPVFWMKQRQLLLVALLLMVVVLVLPLIASLLPVGETFGPNHMQSPLYGASILQVWSVYAFPPVRLIEFILGMIAARAVREKRLPIIPMAPAFVVSAIGYALSLTVPTLWQMSAIFVLPVLVLIVAAAQSPAPPRFLVSPLAVRFGEISFALYMVHDIVLTGIGIWLGPLSLPPLAALASIIAILGTSVVLAWCLWKFVEGPSNSFIRSLSLPPPRKMEA